MYTLSKNQPFYYALVLLRAFFWYPSAPKYSVTFILCSLVLRLLSTLAALGTLAHFVLNLTGLLFMFPTLPSLLNGLIVGETRAEISEDIGDLTGFVGCMSACLNFLWHHSRWSSFFNRLLDFKQFGKPPGYVKVVRRGNLTTLACILYTIPGMLWYSHLTHLDIPRCETLNREFGMKEACGMVNPTWIPPGYDRKNGWRFWVLYVLQCTGIFVYLPSTFVISNIPLEAVGVIVTRIDHLKYHLKRCGSDLGRLYHCVKYHQDIIEVSKELSDLVQATLGTLLLTGAVVIGSLGSQVIKASTPKAVTFILGYVTTIFMVCHAGQKLINQSLTLADQVYWMEWYEQKPKIRKDLRFVLARCQKPLGLVGPPSMGFAGYSLFLIMLKTSYSYLTLLNEVMS